MCAVGAVAQVKADHLIRHIPDENLVSRTVHSIFQDDEGYLWIGTQAGTYLYNGQHFKMPKQLPPSARRPIASICGLNGNYWLSYGDENKSLLFGKKQGLITRGHLWNTTPFVHDRDTFLLSTSTFEVHLSNFDTALSSTIVPGFGRGLISYRLPTITSISSRSLDSVLVGTTKGLFLYVYGHCHRLGPKRFHNVEISAISKNEVGCWMGTKDWLYRISETGMPIDSVRNPNGERIKAIAYSKRAGLWFSTSAKELYSYHDQSLSNETEAAGIPGVLVNTIFMDQNHDVWLGTNGKGLIHVHTGPFNYISLIHGIKDNWLKDRIRVSKKRHLLLTGGGLSGWHDSLQILNEGLEEENNYFYQALAISPSFYALAMQHSDKHMPSQYMTVFGKEVVKVSGTALFRIDSNRFLFGQHSSGVYLHNKTTKTSKLLEQFLPASISAFCLAEDSLLLVGTRRGIRFFDLKTLKKKPLEHGIPQSLAELKNQRIYQIVKRMDGAIWVVYNGGVAQYKQGMWTDALPTECSDLLYTCAAQDKLGRMFMGHQHGVTIISGDSITELGLRHGLPSLQVHYLSVDLQENTLWIGTDQGIVTLPLARLKELVATVPSVKLLDLELMPDSLLRYPWGELSLRHTENDISIHYDLLNIPGLERAYTYYKVNNPDNKWVQADNNAINWYNLSPGTYTVWIAAGYSDKKLVSIKPVVFTIHPPFWKTPLAMGLGIAGFLLLGTFLALWRIRYIRLAEFEKRRVMTQIHVLQQQSMTAMMNPHFIFNALNAVQNFALRHKDRVASQFIADLAKFIRTQMHMLEKNTILLGDEMNQLRLYLQLESKRFDDAFHYTVTVEQSLLDMKAEIPPMLIQPFAENAIWHGLLPKDGIKKLNVSVTQITDNALQVVIEDNGVGFKSPKDSKHQSRGIQLIRKRLELHNEGSFEGDIVIGTGENGGVVVSVKIRLHNVD